MCHHLRCACGIESDTGAFQRCASGCARHGHELDGLNRMSGAAGATGEFQKGLYGKGRERDMIRVHGRFCLIVPGGKLQGPGGKQQP